MAKVYIERSGAQASINHAFFDNDGTLYRPSAEFMDAIRDKVIGHISRKLSMPTNEVAAERKRLNDRYGVDSTAMLFLLGHGLDFAELVNESYMKVDPRKYGLGPDERLSRMLKSIPIPKTIFTNNPSEFAAKILEILEVSDCFEMIISPRELDFTFKPEHGAFSRSLEITGYAPRETIFIDDALASVIAAKKEGMVGLLVGSEDVAADNSIEDIYALAHLLRIAE